MRAKTAVILTFMCLCASARSQSIDPILERYIRLALTQNPVIAAAELERDAAAERIPQTGALPDPMIGFGIDEYPFQTMGPPGDSPWERSGKVIALRQQFPWFGTLGSERKMAQWDYEMKAAMAVRERAMLTLDVKKMYVEWAKIREEQALLDSTLAAMDVMNAQTERAHASGMGNMADVLRAKIERTRMQTMKYELNAMEVSAVAELNICCQLNPDSMTTPPLALEYYPRTFSYDSLLAWSTIDNPDLQAAEAKRSMSSVGVSNARKMRYPMFDLSAEVMQRTEDNEQMQMLSGMIGVTLPIWSRSKQNRLIAERKIGQVQADAERDVAFNLIRFKLSTLLSRQKSLTNTIELYQQEILPSAIQHIQAASSAYASGQLDFMILLNAIIAEFDYRREFAGFVADYNTTWAELEAVTGRTLN